MAASRAGASRAAAGLTAFAFAAALAVGGWLVVRSPRQVGTPAAAVLPHVYQVRIPAGVTAVGLTDDPGTGGYWVLTSDGGVHPVDAPWHGSLAGHLPASSRVTAISAAAGNGYRILLSDGAVRCFAARDFGSAAGTLPPGVTAVSMADDQATGGYWILLSDGRVDAFHAARRGSLAGHEPAGSAAVAITSGRASGYRILVSHSGQVPADLSGRIWNAIPTTQKIVALTFDIGPTDGVPKILATLRRDHVRGTFNIVGRVAREHPATIRAIAAAGELLGDHSNNHPHFPKISDRRVRSEVLDAAAEIEELTGRVVQPWFRFPFGESDPRTLKAVNSDGFVPVGWTVDTLGWMGASRGITTTGIVARVLAARRPGEIVLMHGGADTPGDHSTPDADALATVIRRLRASGYSFVTMDVLRGIGASQAAVNGKVASFGVAAHGSDAGRLPAQVTAVGLASDPAGGYWILLSTGGVDAFGAPSLGSLAHRVPAGSLVTGIAATPGGGYLILASDGLVRSFAHR
jgi:peptidoglycan/xylan/chitin deacetylase (PgdA/CDA1 family)